MRQKIWTCNNNFYAKFLLYRVQNSSTTKNQTYSGVCETPLQVLKTPLQAHFGYSGVCKCHYSKCCYNPNGSIVAFLVPIVAFHKRHYRSNFLQWRSICSIYFSLCSPTHVSFVHIQWLMLMDKDKDELWKGHCSLPRVI